ncbi:unnamed protein product [Porites evermanni]|uniref:Uncharacterized protein n=1 Tax=Porites evermanni TaxID=104178 RepID=A0ABN8STL7_9CNID|nr:unnamed protein product [Porites evermanni]
MRLTQTSLVQLYRFEGEVLDVRFSLTNSFIELSVCKLQPCTATSKKSLKTIAIVTAKNEADNRVDSTVCLSHEGGFSTRLKANRYGHSIAIAYPRDRNGQLTTLETDDGGTEWNYSSSESIRCYQNQALNRD